eukprot:gene33471-38914_t
MACDIRKTDEVERAIAMAAETWGGIDVVVNNAGIGAFGDVSAQTDDEWIRLLDVNVIGVARVSRAALPWLRHSERAAIVNTCSAVASIGLPGRVLYSASKGAVLAMTRAMAADFVADGIRVNCVTPGVVDTPWHRGALSEADYEARRAALARLQPNGRCVSDLEVARAIAYLASPLSSAITGTDLPVDGGMHSLRMQTIEVPVLVVGGGVVGLSASMILSTLGVTSLLVNNYPSTSPHPKAHILNQRTMEIFSEVGAAETIYAVSTPPEHMRYAGWFTGVSGPSDLYGREI